MGNVTFSHQIRIETVKLLYQQIRLVIWAESIAAIDLTAVLWNASNPYLLAGWLAFNLIFCGFARHLLVFFFHKAIRAQPLTDEKARWWLIWFSIGVFLSGMSWGATGSILLLKNDMARQMFTIFLLIGVTAGANPFYSPIFRVYILFLVPAFLPFASWLMLQGNIFIMLGVLAIIYIFIMSLASYYASNVISTSLRLRFENNGLVEELVGTMNALEKRTRELEKSLSLVKATLESSTDGILVIDSKNKIDDFNQKLIEMWKLPPNILGQGVVETFNEIICDQLMNSKNFIKKFETGTNDLIENMDEILFKDGRIFECYSRPQCIGEMMVGRVFGFRDVTERKLMESKLFYQANFDSLTGLPNRTLVLDRISQAIAFARREKLKVAILFLDLDQFKLVNDTLGHSLGDNLLKAVAERLLTCVRKNDTVSRQGGDEFLITITSLKNESDAIVVTRKCLDVLREPFFIDGHKIIVTISIGISTYPDNALDAETLIRNADIAMYKAKELGRNNFQFYTHEMNEKILYRLKMENDLREALDASDQIFIVYQPIVSLTSGRVVSLEALLRWNHPERGMIEPSEFILIAEQSGMIMRVGEWVLRAACLQVKAWQKRGFADFKISINVSMQQFRQVDFFEQISQMLHEINLDPHFLVLELTENSLMEDMKKSIPLLNKLKSIGISIVIDDFGVGYSSLNYLKRLPVDKVKIDRSFIMDIPHDTDDVAITSAILAMAKNLNIKVIAEGVENIAQLKFLIEHQCDEIQGFYFSNPLTVDMCAQLFAENKRWSVPTSS